MTNELSNVPQINRILPPFSLPAVVPTANGLESSTRTNADYAGKSLVIFVYPKDATSGCTIEVCGFRDLYDEFRVLDIEIVGLSRDSVGAHRKFIQSQQLPFALLSGKERTLMESWDLIFASTMYGKPVTKVRRATFLIDASGIVRQIWNDVSPLGHAAEVLESARQLAPELGVSKMLL